MFLDSGHGELHGIPTAQNIWRCTNNVIALKFHFQHLLEIIFSLCYHVEVCPQIKRQTENICDCDTA